MNCFKILCLKICPAGKTSYIHENSNEARDVLGDPRLTWVEIKKKKNADDTKKQSECMIRHRALREKKNYNKINKQLNFVSLSLQNEKYILKKILLVLGLESKTFRLVWGMVYPLCQIMKIFQVACIYFTLRIPIHIMHIK